MENLTSDFGTNAQRQPLNERVFQLFTFYEHYLYQFYSTRPELLQATFDEQMQALYQDGFGVFHVYAPYLNSAGINAAWAIANCEPAQKRWAIEHGVPFRQEHWKEDIARAQIGYFQPTTLYTLDSIYFDSRFTRTLAPRPELIVGWRGAEIPSHTDWSDFDLIVSHLTSCRSMAKAHGAKNTEFFHPAVPSHIKELVAHIKPQYDVVFSGQWTNQHSGRNRLITQVAEAAARGEFSLGLFLSSGNDLLPPVVSRFNQGPRWGRQMYETLRSGKISLNAEIDMAKGDAGNLRLFETTAVGSFLLTEHQTNIEYYLTPGIHIDTYQSAEELVEKIRYYLLNDAKRLQMAEAAQRHIHAKFGMDMAALELIALISKHRGTETMLNTTSGLGPVNYAINSALNFLENSDADAALRILDEAKALDPKVRDFYHVRGMCLVELSRLEEAAASIESELQLFPDNSPAATLLGQIKDELKAVAPKPSTTQSIPAMADLERMANEAVTLLRSGDGVAAMRKADALAAIAPKVSGVHYLRVLCLNGVGRHEEALEAAKQELAINPTHPGARAEFDSLSKALGKRQPPKLNPEQRSYHSALDAKTMASIQNATHNYSYRGVPMIKNPFDSAIYPLLLWQVKPKTIIEIGSKSGGSALWFGDMLQNFGIDGHVYSLDIVKVSTVSHPRVTFMEANGRELEKTLEKSWLEALPRPLLVIEDADHSYETSSAVLRFFAAHLRPDEYIVIEDGIISDLSNDAHANSGPHRAIKEFIGRHPGEYDIDAEYADYFGYNFTWCTNGFLRKKRYALNPQIAKSTVREFLEDDPAPLGAESQMSVNERFQLYYALRACLPKNHRTLRFLEIGSYAGASLRLQFQAAKRDGRPFSGIAIEPGGQPQFYLTLQELNSPAPCITHLKALSHDALSQARALCQQDGVFPELIVIDGDHSYEGVRQDILDYYDLLAPGGIMVFHDFLPELNDQNREAIHFHHAGTEPGIRRACQELMEKQFGLSPLELPLLYPQDPTQTQPHLPIIPGVFSTIRAYKKQQ